MPCGVEVHPVGRRTPKVIEQGLAGAERPMVARHGGCWGWKEVRLWAGQGLTLEI